MNLRNRINQQRQRDLASREDESSIVRGPSTLDLLNAQVREVAIDFSQKREPQVEIEFLKRLGRVWFPDVDTVRFSEYVNGSLTTDKSHVKKVGYTGGWILKDAISYPVFSSGEYCGTKSVDLALTAEGQIWWNPVSAYGATDTYGVFDDSYLKRDLAPFECDQLLVIIPKTLSTSPWIKLPTQGI